MRKNNNSKIRILAAAISGIACIAACLLILFYNNEQNVFNANDNKTQSSDFVKFIDVGQGDCILIKSGDYSALIDTGLKETANNVCAVLDNCGIDKIDVLLISHLHKDHTGGLQRIIETYRIDNLILPTISIESEELGAAEFAISKITKEKGKIFEAVSGMNFKIGNFEMTVLASFGNMQSENNRSVFVAAQNEGIKFLFTGDAESKAEEAILNENLNLKCDVLKVAHHGSSGSCTEKFVNAVNPRYVAISVGSDNIYGHPSSRVLSLFESKGIEIYRTDLHSDITFYINKGKLTPYIKNKK